MDRGILLSSEAIRNLENQDYILYANGSLNLPTTGTVQQTLLTVTVPANVFPDKYMGIEIQGVYTAAANANNKTVTVQLGGVTLTSSTSATSGQTWFAGGICYVGGTNSLPALGQFSIATGLTSGTGIFTPDFTLPILITFLATTATSAGDVTLRSARVALKKKVA